jgi:hypothetical protein
MAFTFDKAAPEEMDVTLFSPNDPFAVAKGLEVTEEAQKVFVISIFSFSYFLHK